MAYEDGAWGDNGAWWIIIFLIFAMGGYGRNGFGGTQGGVADNYVLASDFANIERKLDGVNNGLCDGFYAMNTGMLNGFSGVTSAVTTSGYETRNTIADLSSQLASCCCTTQRAIDGINYNMAMNNNALQQTICNSTRDIIESQNANYRALHDELVSQRIEAKDLRIADLQAQVNALNLSASQIAQNNYLISQLKGCGCSTTM